MGKTKELIIAFSILGLVIMAGCGKTGVDPSEDATDEDAIFNIIRYDEPTAFDLDLIDFSIPDTSMVLGYPYRPVHFWRTIETDSLNTALDVRLPGPGDTIGTVAQATAVVRRIIRGKLEIIAVDTVGGSDLTVRLSKNYRMVGNIDAFFEKVGFDYNTRRGWVLRRISDAIFKPVVGDQSVILPTILISRASEPDSTITIYPGIKTISLIPQFAMGESLLVTVLTQDTAGFVTMRFPSGNGYVYRRVEPTNPGIFISGFTLPNYLEFNHIAVDVVASNMVADTSTYKANMVGAIYRAR